MNTADLSLYPTKPIEIDYYSVDKINMYSIFPISSPNPMFNIELESEDYKRVSFYAKSLLLGEDIVCRFVPVRSLTAVTCIFSEPVKVTYRNSTAFVSNMSERSYD